MKKIKITCLDKLLAISSCLVATSCSKSPNSQEDNERYVHNSNTASILVPVQTPKHPAYQNGAFEPWDAATMTKPDFSNWTAALDSYTLPSLSNVDLPFGREKITVDILLQGLNSCQRAIEGTNDFNSAYTTVLYWNAFIHSFGNFGFPDDAQIILGTAVHEVYKKASEIANSHKISDFSNKFFCEELRKRIEGQNDEVAKASVCVTYSEVKKFFDDICFAFLRSNPPATVKGSTLSKWKFDEINALRDVMISQNTASVDKALKKCIKSVNENTYKAVLDHEHRPFVVQFRVADIPVEFNDFDKNDFWIDVSDNSELLRKKPIVQLISQPDNEGVHHNPAFVNNNDDIALLNQRFLDTRGLFDEYRDEKKGITSDDKKKLLKNLEDILVATIYRGINHNQVLVDDGKLDSLDHFQKQNEPLECLKKELLQVTDYSCKKLQDALKAIFGEAEEVKKQVETPNTVEGKSTKDLSVLLVRINEINDIINKDWELFTLVQLTYAPLNEYLSDGEFIKNVGQKIIDILKSNNDLDQNDSYGSFLKSVLDFLSTWQFNAATDNPSWIADYPNVQPIKCESPLLFQNGERNDSLVDVCFNNLQDILYGKYSNCVLPKTFQDCQKLYALVNDEEKGIKGVFNELNKLHGSKDFQENVSFRVLDLFDLCFSDTSGKLYNFYDRLPKEGKEYFPDLIEEKDASKIIQRIDDIEQTMVSARGEECPKIENAITGLVNYAVADINNEVIAVIYNAGFSENLENWKHTGSLLHNVKWLKANLYKFVKKFDLDNFQKHNNVIFPLVPLHIISEFKDEVFWASHESVYQPFHVKDYTTFFDQKWNIENNSYYLLRCLRFLGDSIPRRFLKNEAQNLKEAYRNCTNLSLTFCDVTTSMLEACAKNLGGWEMVGFNEHCKLHIAGDNGKYNKAIVCKPKNEQEFLFDDTDSLFFGRKNREISPFFSDFDNIDQLSDAWDQSRKNFDDVIKDIPLTCPANLGFNNPIDDLQKVIDWTKSDFNNFICGVDWEQGISLKTGGRRETITKTVESLYPKDRGVNTLNQHERLLKTNKNEHITKWGNYNQDPCLCVNEKIAKDRDAAIPFHDVLCYIRNQKFSFPNYFALTKDNFDRKYSLTTFGGPATAYNNFNILLNQVKTHIEDYYKSFGKFDHDLIGKNNLASLWNGGNEGKALVSFYLLQNLNCSFTYDQLLKYFITRPTDKVKDLTDKLGKNIIDANDRDNCATLSQLIQSKQFENEIYNADPGEKINNYSDVLKFFNDPSLYNSKDITQKWKNKFKTFVEDVHTEWCKGFMNYRNGLDTKTVKDILSNLGCFSKLLDQDTITTLQSIKDEAKNLTFPDYNNRNGSIKTLDTCQTKIQNAIIQLQNFNTALNNNNVANDTFTQITTLIGDLKNECSTFVNDLKEDHINSWGQITEIFNDVKTCRTNLETISQNLKIDDSINQDYCNKLVKYCLIKKNVENNPNPARKLKGEKRLMEAWGWGGMDYNKAKCDAEVQKIKQAFSNLQTQLKALSDVTTQLDNLTKLTNPRMEMLKYVAANHNNPNSTIGKLISNLKDLNDALSFRVAIDNDSDASYTAFNDQKTALENVIVTSFDLGWNFDNNKNVVTGVSTIYPNFFTDVEKLYREETLTELLQ